MLCDEKKWEYSEIKNYLNLLIIYSSNNIKIQRFPLCIKESGGMYERGKDKTAFLESLSKVQSDNASAFTIKLTENTILKLEILILLIRSLTKKLSYF